MSRSIDKIDIKEIKDPSFLKTLDYDSLSVLCHDLRTEIITATSEYGGHLSSNLGVVELTVALHRVFNFPEDKLIFDVGHQCYAHKLLTGRSLDHLNEGGYCAGFQKICESPYDP
ncbi:MAG: 1-deoxy-D-xylulose-5-phosphate synthase, partial [Bacilli bacterium]|nr:1-deoxy-D-xylulose-5-phosphate synthase [Bacilli bacterium]